VLPERRDVQLPEQIGDDQNVLGQLLAQIPVAAGGVCRLHDHGHQAERVDAGDLHHARHLPHPIPGRCHICTYAVVV
jgi:hypothetical protein